MLHPVVTFAGVQPAKLLLKLQQGKYSNVDFGDLVRLVRALGFDEVGGRGSHRVFARPDIAELVNLQEVRGEAKRYQARQVAELARRYALTLEVEQ